MMRSSGCMANASRSLRHANSGARGARALPVWIGEDDTAPARAVERLPRPFALRQTIGDRIDHGRMMTHAAMAAFDLDTLGGRRCFLDAALPGAGAVGAAEDR